MKFKDLKIGDKIVVADSKKGNMWQPQGKMDKYLGKALTVNYIGGNLYGKYVKVEENEWAWFEDMIDFDKTYRFNNELTLSDLLDGDKLYVRDDVPRFVLPSIGITVKKDCYQGVSLKHYTNDLKCKQCSDFDIMKVERRGQIIWERKEQKIVKMTAEELLKKLGLDGNTKLEII